LKKKLEITSYNGLTILLGVGKEEEVKHHESREKGSLWHQKVIRNQKSEKKIKYLGLQYYYRIQEWIKTISHVKKKLWMSRIYSYQTYAYKINKYKS